MTSVATASGFGKLMIAGEYAVTRPGRRAIVMAVDRTVDVRARYIDDPGAVVVLATREEFTARHTIADLLVTQVPTGAPRRDYVASAVSEVLAIGLSGGGFDDSTGVEIVIAGGFDDPVTGAKYGLGGSAAVTVAVIGALQELLGLGLSPGEQWKLAYLSTVRVNPRASGADLAAALFGGWIDYRSPDRVWLDERARNSSTGALLSQVWPCLRIERIDAPIDDAGLVVGWSGRPASTPRLAGLTAGRLSDRLLAQSDRLVSELRIALDANDRRTTAATVHRAQSLLQTLDDGGDGHCAGIVTPELRELIDSAHLRGVAAKVSGAGGGDCCIGLAGSAGERASVVDAWGSLGYPVLTLRSSAERPMS